MNVRDPHTLSFRNPGLPPEELDTLLTGFFRSEMPDPWPVLKAPAEAPFRPAAPVASRWTSVRSRVALAASVALLLVGTWCFSAKAPDYSLPPLDNGDGRTGAASGLRIYEGGKPVLPKKVESKTNSNGCCDCGK
jgi:hypothetical protein